MAPQPPSDAPAPIVISGPSGSGKSTIIKKLFAEYPDRFGFSVSHTTRQPRAGEADGKDYYFVTKDAFQSLVKENGFVEHAQFGSNNYGTSVMTLQSIAKEGKQCILDIEMEGVKQIRAHPTYSKTARFLFLQPPSEEILEQRLRGRGTDKEEAIQERLAQAKKEMDYAKTPGVHDKTVVNDDLERAYQEVRKWIVEEV